MSEKMKWTKLITKFKGKVLLGAIQMYNTAYGEVAVGFTPASAYVLEDEQGLYTTKDLEGCIKQHAGTMGYPETCEEYREVVGATDNTIVIERLGLGEHLEDIKARIEELIPYGLEMDKPEL